MKTARALMTVVAVAAVLGTSSIAVALPFQVEVSVGWINATGVCNGASACLGFAGVGGFAGTSTRLNWDNQTSTVDSFLSIGALPDTVPFGNPPIGFGKTTIDVGQTVRTAQIRHTNNQIEITDDFLGSITVRTLLRILSPDGTVAIIDQGTGGDLDIPLTFLETNNRGGDVSLCDQTKNSLGSACDDQFTFFSLAADIPFEFGGNSYILQARGPLNPDGTFACEDAGGGQLNCLTREGAANDRFIAITLLQVSAPPSVPAPATLLLLGLGMAGLSALPLIRKRS